MKFIKPDVKILSAPVGGEALRAIEMAGRTCYKSEHKITEDSAKRFVNMLIDKGHDAMLEHGGMITVKFICDRGVSHQLVRHRLFSFAQESTRYCRYKDGIQVVIPSEMNGDELEVFVLAMQVAEHHYMKLLEQGVKAEIARAVLPTAVKTEVIVSGNPRQWREFFKLRCANDAHPDIRYLSRKLLRQLWRKMPVLFEDIGSKYVVI